MQTWAEKYRPETLSEFKGSRKEVEETLNHIKSWKTGEKVLLIAGKSGTGKTSLIHCIANDLKYELYEVNASDIRTKEALQTTLRHVVSQHSFFGRKKIILIDEVDTFSSSDRGGRAELVKIVKDSRFPVVFTANDLYGSGMQPIRNMAHVIKLSAHTNTIKAHLKEICSREGIEYEDTAVDSIARYAGGNMRSAINDLESLAHKYKKIDKGAVGDLSHRDSSIKIFDLLKVIFKTRNAATAREAISNIDETPDQVFQWIRENVPREYKRPEDASRAYDCLSKADLFRGRIIRRQGWYLLKYVFDLMSVGVALSKDERYEGFTKYAYPSYLKMMGRSKSSKAMRKHICEKIAGGMHLSQKEASGILDYFKLLFKDEELKRVIANRYELSKEEIGFIERG